MRSSVLRFSSFALVGLCVLHMLLFLPDLIIEAPRWLDGSLWTTQHLAPFATQPPSLAVSGAAFWATFGSSLGPLLILAWLLIHLERTGVPVPHFVPVALLVWAIGGSVIMEPSGFPLIVVLAIGLLVGVRRATRR